MKSITFECEVITPMFLAGADGQTPELRPPSIKGAMRFWWRAVNGHLSLAELKRKEAEIFGGGGTQATQSAFSIIAIEKNMKITEKPFVPHKSFMKQKAFLKGSTFDVKLIFKNEKYFEKISTLFILVSFLGGFGKRVRRGMGSFIINNYVTDKKFDVDLEPSSENIKILIKKINPFAHFLHTNDNIQIISNSKEKYPFIKEIKIRTTNTNIEKSLLRISNASHTISSKYKEKASYVLGGVKGGRFASPIIPSLYKSNSIYIFVSKLATFPKPKYRKHIDENIQDEFIDIILENSKKLNFDSKKINIKKKDDWIDQITEFDIEIRIEELKLKNFKKFRGEYKFVFDKKTTVFIGDNGFGKTSILEALAISSDLLSHKLFNKQKETDLEQLKKLINNNETEGKIETIFNLSINFAISNEITTKDNKYLDKIYDSKSEKYKIQLRIAHTTNLKTKETSISIEDEKWIDIIKNQVKEKKEKYPIIFFGNKIEEDTIMNKVQGNDEDYTYYKALSSDRYNFKSLQKWIKKYLLKQEIEIIRSYFKTFVIKTAEVLNNDNSNEKYKIKIKIKDKIYEFCNEENNNKSKNCIKHISNVTEIVNFEFIINKTQKIKEQEHIFELSYNQLSAGEKNVFSIVADLISRIFSATEETDKEKLNELLVNAKAIILIDELDLHLHPKWQREILPKLREIFPNVQFIITTHSPFVLQNFKETYGKIAFLSENEVSYFNKAYGKSLELILLELMGLDKTRPNEILKTINKIEEYIDKNKINEAKNELENLSNLLSEKDEEVIRLSTIIEFLEDDD